MSSAQSRTPREASIGSGSVSPYPRRSTASARAGRSASSVEQRLLPEERRADVAVHEEHGVAGPAGSDALGVQHRLGQPGGRHRRGGDPGSSRSSGMRALLGRAAVGSAASGASVSAGPPRGDRRVPGLRQRPRPTIERRWRAPAGPGTVARPSRRRPPSGSRRRRRGPRRGSAGPCVVVALLVAVGRAWPAGPPRRGGTRRGGQPLHRPRSATWSSPPSRPRTPRPSPPWPATAGCPTAGHRDRAGDRPAGVPAAQPRLRRPRLARALPAAPLAGLGHRPRRCRTRSTPPRSSSTTSSRSPAGRPVT